MFFRRPAAPQPADTYRYIIESGGKQVDCGLTTNLRIIQRVCKKMYGPDARVFHLGAPISLDTALQWAEDMEKFGYIQKGDKPHAD